MLQGEYLGMRLTIEDVDKENLAFFNYCAQGDFRLQRGKKSGLLRYPPTTACPWTRDREYEWVSVEGKGTVHSYVEVHHAIQPAFREHVPYMILLVDLDTQKGQPSEHEALRVVGNLLTADGEFAPPEMIRKVGIGTRVRMIFKKVSDGFALPHWTIDEEAEQPAHPWRYPQG
ncbi:MAG TPA: OB-fold domain-containing protein [Candidatus Binatia bacterium]|nr:OB-fold domain-containing protein [Candidatus Binatia bacterium]